MLARQGILSADDARAIDEGLLQVAAEIEAGQLQEDQGLEDIHMHVEHRLAELIGDAAGRLHTARSRNDQVATDFKLFVRNAVDEAVAGIEALESVLLQRAEEHAGSVMPGFTHLQSGQPVTLGHHLLAYREMLARDRSRFVDARARMNESPLGSAALAGTGFPPARLELEITETVLMRDNPETTAQLHALIARGIRIALDDFGTGYSALAYLARLPHHRIKLDKAFVQDLGNPATADLIRAIIALARAQGVAVTAEGVERPEHLAQVRRADLDAGKDAVAVQHLKAGQHGAPAKQGYGGNRRGRIDPLHNP